MIVNGWFDFAVQVLGPTHKQAGYASGHTTRIGKGAVVHSAVGSATSLLYVLNGPLSKSWTVTLLKSGETWQHYPIQAICWHAGGPLANERYVGIECEGGAIGNESEPLTTPQLDSLVRVLADLMAFEGWARPARGETLFEHNQFFATACPSGRIPWDVIIPRLQAPAPPLTPLYTREQGLWAIQALGFKYGIQQFDPKQGLRDLHQFDLAILDDLIAKARKEKA